MRYCHAHSICRANSPKVYLYLYVDPETNQVHLLVPVVGGQDISTDNTCKSTAAMDEFFQQGGGALRELNAYKAARNSPRHPEQLYMD